MQMDLRTVNIEPLRRSFAHVERRIGPGKTASRYQEATFDMQTEAPQHYRPLWDPAHEYFDTARTRIVMADWYAFKDPRQCYYGSYVMARARQQEAAESAFAFVESRNLALTMPGGLVHSALDLLLPLRHVAWGCSMNNDAIAAYGFGAAITQPALYYAMDQLGIAQFITRTGLLFEGADALDTAREAWLGRQEWQPLRRLVEDLFVESDWFEVLVAQDLVLDGLLYPLVYGTIVDDHIALQGGAAISMVCQFQSEWAAETAKWVDAQIKVARAESAANADLVDSWAARWKARAVSALLPVAGIALGAEAESRLAEVLSQFDKRLARLGIVQGAKA